MLQTVIKKHRIYQHEIAAALGSTIPTVNRKLRGRSAWWLKEAQAVTRFVNEFTGEAYTVDQLFPDEEAATSRRQAGAA